MKKNLRIVSAAAAALLAVAPVAAAAVAQPATSVQAATTTKAIFKNVADAVNAANSVSATDTTKAVDLGSISLENPADQAAAVKQIKSEIAKQLNVKVSDLDIHVKKSGLGKDSSVVYKFTVTTTGEKNQQLNASFGWANGKLGKNGTEAIFAVRAIKGTAAAKKDTTPSTSINAGSTSIFNKEANTFVNLSAVAKSSAAPSAINGNVTVTLKGKTYTALLHGSQNTTIYELKNGKLVKANELHSGHKYLALLNDVTVNLGNSYAGQSVEFVLGKDTQDFFQAADGKESNVNKVTVDKDGIAHLGNVVAPFYAYDPADLQEVHFFSQKTGNVVTSGSVDLHAVNGKLSVQSVYAALTQEYIAAQLRDGNSDNTDNVDTLVPVDDIKAQLTKAGIKVDDNGYFTAPASFKINMTAKSNRNGATATLPVTVNVDNAAASTTTANEQTTTKTIMHIATIYDKNGKATNEPVLRAYNSVSVVSTPVELKDASGKSLGRFYKLAGKDEYIKVGNIDGTSRSLKHNSYVYKANGKPYMKSKKHHEVLKSGASVTTYGKSFKNDVLGTQVYRIGRNRYVKVANFR